MNLNALNMFVLVVQHGGFSEAARKSGTAVATLSRNVKELEASLGIRLLERSTRHLRTTTEGEMLYQFSARGFDEIKAGELALTDRQDSLKGSLRLSIPTNIDFWWDVLNEFQDVYPDITLDIFTSERRIDLIADGIDVALRIGELKTQTAVARKIGDYRHVLVVSPKYIQEKGCPETPDQLASYPCAAWQITHETPVWNLGGKDVEIRPVVKVNVIAFGAIDAKGFYFDFDFTSLNLRFRFFTEAQNLGSTSGGNSNCFHNCFSFIVCRGHQSVGTMFRQTLYLISLMMII